jgi:4-amino-4-deoxy-L-arabinose transferase-like glycosyltransferase
MLASITPLYAAGSMLMTVDTVYIFFWAMAALVFWHAKDSERLAPWMLTGALLGLSVLAKYTAAFELFSIALFCVWYAPARRHLRSIRFGVMLLTVAAFLLPVVVWNVIHGWPTSRFLFHRGDLDEQAHLHPLNTLIFLGGQAGVISPLIFFGILVAALKPKQLGAASTRG